MDLRVTPKKPAGRIEIPASKSMAHRIMIAAAFSDRETQIALSSSSQDIEATADCLRALGARITKDGDLVTVSPIRYPKENPKLDCRESGSTLRFLLPVASAVCEQFEITGRGRLPERPNEPLTQAMRQHGVSFSGEKLPLCVQGKLRGGMFRIRGDISSQYITGLLLAFPLLREECALEVTTPLESADYAEMTLFVMRMFGVRAERRGSLFTVPAGASYRSPGFVRVEGDYSNASYFFAANYLGAEIELSGLPEESAQGDRRFPELLETLGDGSVIDGSDIPDLIPALSVCACGIRGRVTVRNIRRLRFKESDRIESIRRMICSLGGNCTEGEDSLVIEGTGKLRGGTVESFGDHRIVMSAAAASCICENPVIIRDAQAVSKSYPDFFEQWNRTGGQADVIDVWKQA